MEKYYVVRKGYKTGIFNTWEECKELTHGYPCAEFKSFPTMNEAEKWYNQSSDNESDHKEEHDERSSSSQSTEYEAYVDGSFLDGVGYGSGVVILCNKKIIYKASFKGNDPELLPMRNVAGEICASEHAAEYCLNNGIEEVSLYYDYLGIEKWADSSWKANKKGTKAYRDIMAGYTSEIDIKFKKIKAHSGVMYNELADKLAKQAVGI